MIEVLTGANYFEIIRQHIFVPVGMECACFSTADTVCEQLAEVYVATVHASGGIKGW